MVKKKKARSMVGGQWRSRLNRILSPYQGCRLDLDLLGMNSESDNVEGLV